MEVHRSARKHGVADGDMLHTGEHAVSRMMTRRDEVAVTVRGNAGRRRLMAAKKVHGTSRGVPIDDDAIEALVAEAEAGYDPAVLRRRGGRLTIC